MKLKLLFTISLLAISYLLSGQIIDNFGVNIGATLSNQKWEYESWDTDQGEKYAIGFMAFVSVEKEISSTLSLKCDFGYLQKGFKEYLDLTNADGTTLKTLNERIILNNLAINPFLKVKPFESKISPYFFVGIRTEYLLSYKDASIKEEASGNSYNMYESILKEFNKFNLGGLFGIGCDINELFYIEIEFNPNFTNNFDNGFLKIKDNCFGAKIGLNINKLVK